MDIGNSNWNETDASNTTAAPDGAPEGMNPSGVDDVLRAHQGAVKRWYDWSIPLTTGGSSTAYTLTYAVAPTLNDGMTHLVRFNAVNGANPTLNVNSLGAKPLTFFCGGASGSWSSGTNTMPANMLGVNQIVPVTYDATSGTYRCVNLPLVLQQTASAATNIDFANIPTNVNNIQLSGAATLSINTATLELQTFTAAGSISNGGTDYSTLYTISQASVTPTVTSLNAAYISITTAADSTGFIVFNIVGSPINTATIRPSFNGSSQYTVSGSYTGQQFVAQRNSTAVISGVRVLASTGTFTGPITLIMS